MPARSITDVEINQMAEMREQGKGFEVISRHFARQGRRISASTISWHCLRVGADAPPAKRGPAPSPNRKAALRKGFVVRPFSPDEDRRILELEAEGLGDTAIGRAIGRRPNSVRGRLMTLARHDARSEAA